jgi:hypothetical protein
MNCAEWVLRRRDGDGAWKTTARVPTQGDDLVAAASTGAGTMVLTRGRVIAGTPISEASRDLIVHRGLVIALAENKQTAAPLSQFLYAKPVAATHATPTAVFVGFDKGEWGGGLQRIDRQTGAVVSIEQKDWGQPCYGPLDSACDPVNGIATAPWDPGCVVATIGLLHGMGRGRIVEVCDGVVRRLYVKASSRYGRVGKKAPAAGSSDPDPNPSVAFFGLVRTGDVLWAAGDDGLYQIRADRTVHAMPLPAFTRVGDISVSFDLPELILVLTNIEKSRIGAGAVPLLVPR